MNGNRTKVRMLNSLLLNVLVINSNIATRSLIYTASIVPKVPHKMDT